MPGAHSKPKFNVEELKPKAGGKPVKGSSIPLILPNDMKYNASTGGVEKVRGKRTGLYVVPEALDLLEGIEEPVGVLAICGPARTGKSYILSRMLGTADAFALGHRMDPETFGIWMGTKVLRGKDFTIVLLDTEGIDAVGASAGQDASILVLTILLSSQLIYNSQNVPRKGDLEKMQSFINLAKGITVKQGKRTDTPEVSALRTFFPDFLWLLRDVSLKMEDEDGNEIHPTEYLKTKVLGIQHEKGSTSDKVRQAILNFFPSVECATLERPSGDVDIMSSIAQNTYNLNPKFNQGVENLIMGLLRKAHAKRGYQKGSTVNGVALSIMARQYVEAVNDPNSIPALDNTWQNTIELMRNRAIEEAVMEYKQQMQFLVAKAKANRNGDVPLEEGSLHVTTYGTSSNRKRDVLLEENRETRRSLGLHRVYYHEPWFKGDVVRPRSTEPHVFRRQRGQPNLIDLHNQVFEKVKDMLLKKVGHLGTSSEKREVVDKLQEYLVQKEERTVDHVTSYNMYVTARNRTSFVVTGGELLRFIQENKEHSNNFCKKVSERLLDPIRERVESPSTYYNSYRLRRELRHARQQYEEEARGPEKGAVLQEMTQKCEQLEADFRRFEEHHRQLMMEQQKAKDAERRVRERERQLQQQRSQAQDMPRDHEEFLQKLEEKHRKEMEEVKEVAATQRALEELTINVHQTAMRVEKLKMEVEEMLSELKLRAEVHQKQLELEETKRKLASLEEAIDDLPQARAPPADDDCIIL